MTDAPHKLTKKQEEYKQTLLDVRLRCGIQCSLRERSETNKSLVFGPYCAAHQDTCYTLFFPGCMYTRICGRFSSQGTNYVSMEAAVSLIRLRMEQPMVFAFDYVPNISSLLLKQYLTVRLALTSTLPDDVWYVIQSLLFVLLVEMTVSEYRMLYLVLAKTSAQEWNEYIGERTGRQVDFLNAVSLFDSHLRLPTHTTHYGQTGLVLARDVLSVGKVTVTVTADAIPVSLLDQLADQVGVDIVSETL
jgi:hypothetical protein